MPDDHREYLEWKIRATESQTFTRTHIHTVSPALSLLWLAKHLKLVNDETFENNGIS